MRLGVGLHTLHLGLVRNRRGSKNIYWFFLRNANLALTCFEKTLWELASLVGSSLSWRGSKREKVCNLESKWWCLGVTATPCPVHRHSCGGAHQDLTGKGCYGVVIGHGGVHCHGHNGAPSLHVRYHRPISPEGSKLDLESRGHRHGCGGAPP